MDIRGAREEVKQMKIFHTHKAVEHFDCAERLMVDGSKFSDIWGVNFYPEDKKIDFIALINIRPEKNRTMEIQSEEIKKEAEDIVKKLLPI